MIGQHYGSDGCLVATFPPVLAGLDTTAYHRPMPVFWFVIALVIVAPLAKALARRIERGDRIPPGDRDLTKALQETEQRLADTEARLGAVEGRLDFYEKLLRNPDKTRGQQGL